jgi:Flp pilus assembly protein TadG
MNTHVGRCASERGTVLIQTAIAILALTAFTAFVLDYGVLWVSRNQAQNAADAGALAGAIARAFDETANPPATGGKAELSAKWAARCASGSANCPATPSSANPVWPSQAAASSGVEVLWNCPPTFTGACVTVNVYRDGTNGSTTLPTFFGPLLGITSQGIRATASARFVDANAANCMRPFSVADKWIENTVPDEYNHYDDDGVVLAGTPDQYVPATSSSAGTGYRLPDDFGTEKVLMMGNPSSAGDPIGQGWSLPLRLPDPNNPGEYLNGADMYRSAISGCAAGPVAIGDYLPLETGAMTGPTDQGVNGPLPDGSDSLIEQDPGASFNTSTKTIQGSCAPTCAPVSPRIVPIAVWDIDEFQWRRATSSWGTEVYTDANGTAHSLPGGSCPGTGAQCVRVVNILGFFIDHTTNGNPKTVVGYLTTIPGSLSAGTSGVATAASFLKVIQLVR